MYIEGSVLSLVLLCRIIVSFDIFQCPSLSCHLLKRTCSPELSIFSPSFFSFFSLLTPQSKQLSSHTGWADLANYVLRCHLCLDIPTDGTCGLLVDGEVSKLLICFRFLLFLSSSLCCVCMVGIFAVVCEL